jgi:hypothetical protein
MFTLLNYLYPCSHFDLVLILSPIRRYTCRGQTGTLSHMNVRVGLLDHCAVWSINFGFYSHAGPISFGMRDLVFTESARL